MDIRNVKGEQVELVPGMWYVGMNWMDGNYRNGVLHINVEPTGADEIAQYVGKGEFYDEGCDEPTRMQDYEYIVESHMGKL